MRFITTAVSLSSVIFIQACDSGNVTIDQPSFDVMAAVPGDAALCGNPVKHNIVNATSNFSHDDDYKPSNAIDGNLSSDSRWSSNGSGRSVTLDLGSNKKVSGLRTAWYKADQRQAYFDVESSQNGTSWNTVLADAVVTGTQSFVTSRVAESTARYIRIIGNGNSDSSWNSLIEVEVLSCGNDIPVDTPQSCSGSDNLVIRSASSTDDHDANYSPSRVIDNNLDTESRWSSDGSGRSIILDLGQQSTIKKIATAWYKANQRQAFFDVRTSADKSNWNTVLSQATASGTQGMIEFDVTDSEGRYVEIVGLGNSSSSWNSLIEANVYGCGEIDDETEETTESPTTTEPTEPSGPTGSGSIALLKELFDLEGGSNDLTPYRSNDTLVFDALKAKHVTPNGNGWRHELKMAVDNRKSMYNTSETLSARIKVDMSDGGKTIVAQYHGGGLGTLVKVYVSDTSESRHNDSNPDNGIFDVYIRMRPEGSSSEDIINAGTIRSGQSFNLTIINRNGLVTASAMGVSETMRVANSDNAYLKFGNYLQAQDPYTGDDVDDKDDWEEFYRDAGITESVITFSDVVYTRN